MTFLFNHIKMLEVMMQMTFDKFKLFIISILPPPMRNLTMA